MTQQVFRGSVTMGMPSLGLRQSLPDETTPELRGRRGHRASAAGEQDRER